MSVSHIYLFMLPIFFLLVFWHLAPSLTMPRMFLISEKHWIYINMDENPDIVIMHQKRIILSSAR